MKKVYIVMMTVAVIILMTACMPGDGSYSETNYANLLSGIWHGWLAPLSLVSGLFNDSIRLYEPYNTGWWYDFGFYMAIISGFGSLSLSRKRKKKD